MNQEPLNNTVPPAQKSIFIRLLKGLGLFLVLLALLFLLATILIQTKPVQNWLINKTTTYLSKELQTEVEVDQIDIDFFDQLVLEGFYVEDFHGDTLMYSRALKANLNTSLWKIINKDVQITEITLEDPQFRMSRYLGEKDDQFKQLLNKLSGPQKQGKTEEKKESTPFFLDVDAVYLRNAVFIKDDSVGGEEIKVLLKQGDIFVDSLNLGEKRVNIRKAILSAPYVTLINFPKSPLPDSIENKEIPQIKEVIASELETAPQPDIFQKKWQIFSTDLQLLDGYFEHHNYRKSPIKKTPDNEIDFAHLKVADIQIHLEDFEMEDWVFQAASKQFSLKESSGFVLNNLTANKSLIAPKRVELRGMDLITPYTHLRDSLIFEFQEYPDFKDFKNKVKMHAFFNNAHVALRDIMHFAPKLKKEAFFANNKDEVLYLDGLIKGKVTSLDGRGIKLKLGELLMFDGKFDLHDLMDTKETIIMMEVNRLKTSLETLTQMIPNLSFPPNFEKLGNLDFAGNVIGVFGNFAIDGVLNSDMGAADLNLGFDINDSWDAATYHGTLKLIDFNLREWTGNKDLGKVTLSAEVKNGVGLVLETANAELNAFIDRFWYKGYLYEHLTMKGALDQNSFAGDFAIQDENIDFVFDGAISFEQALPEFKFKAKVNELDLKALKLSPQDFNFSGDIDLKLRGSNIDDLQGFATFYDVNIEHNQEDKYLIDSLKIRSAVNQDRDKVWRFNSEMFTAKVVGDFETGKVKEAILQFIEKNYEGVANRFNIHSKGDTSFDNNRFNLSLNIADSKNFTNLLDPKLDTITNLNLAVGFDYAQDSFLINLDLPTFKYDNIALDGITLSSRGIEEQTGLNFRVNGTNINDQFRLAPLSLLSLIENDSAAFSINTKDLNADTDRLNLSGNVSLIGDLFSISFLPTDLIILNDKWDIAKDNNIQIGKDYVKTNHFVLSRGDRRVSVENVGDKGIDLGITGFNTNYINKIWSYKNLQFDGIYTINTRIKDVFKLEDIAINAQIDSFLINDDLFGQLILEASSDNIKSPVSIKLNTLNGVQFLKGGGIYNPPNMTAGVGPESQPNYLDVGLTLNKYPLDIAEYFVTSGISNTVGEFTAKLNFKGGLPKPKMDGKITIFEGATTLDYTKTRYNINNQKIRMTDEYLFDVSDGYITDQFGNKAFLTGGITHDFFSKLGLNVLVRSDNFQIINTTKGDNDIYYGNTMAKGDISFTGDFDQTNIDIKAATTKGTKIFFPFSSGNSIEETSFIRFVNEKDTIKTKSGATKFKGIKLHMEMEMNDLAEFQLIFDEQAGDVMKGTGFGAVKIDMTRQGDISMYGQYEIEQGKYLFTLFNLVNKPFTVKRGGTIEWRGDPYNALINIDADYSGLHAPPENFILEYLNTENAEAKKSTDVVVSMNLTEQLLKPEIAFNISFPNLTGELKNYTDSKVRAIRLDQNELNRQVFGLIVIGGFLPSDQGGLQGRQLLTGINTISEFLSNQLSLYLTEFISSAVSGKFLNLEDFDVAYNVYESSFINNINTLGTGHEVHLRQRSRIKERWVINAGWDIDLGGSYIQSDEALWGTDIILEYELTKDRRLKIRGYYKNEPEILGGRKNNTGLGLSFRREFDRLDLLSFLKKTAKTKTQTNKSSDQAN